MVNFVVVASTFVEFIFKLNLHMKSLNISSSCLTFEEFE